MYHLSRYEQETIVNFNEEEPTATVYTYNKSFQRKLQVLSEKFLKDVRLIADDQHGGVTYIIPKKWIKINPPRVMSEDQRQRQAERLKFNLGQAAPAPQAFSEANPAKGYTDTTQGTNLKKSLASTAVFEEVEG